LRNAGALKEAADGDSYVLGPSADIVPAAQSLQATGADEVQAKGAHFRGCAPREFNSTGIHNSVRSLHPDFIFQSLNPEPMPEVLSALVLVGVQNGNATLEEIESDL